MHSPYRSLLRVAFLAFTLVALEWLFFVTKPSLFSTAAAGARLASLFVASAPFVLLALLAHAGALALARGGSKLGGGRILSYALRALEGLVPGALLALMALLLVDNFTYTVFDWGVVSTKGLGTVLYLIAWLAALATLVFRSGERSQSASGSSRGATWMFSGWIVLALASTGWLLTSERADVSALGRLVEHSEGKLPNIIIFSADAVISERMSVYGYKKKTTPTLDKLADQALIMENAFSNSGRTTGAVAALSTGRLPTTTKLAFPPQTLEGADAYRSLPRLLRQLGYRNSQETVRYYADGEDLNLREAFDFANGRELSADLIPVSSASIALHLPTTFSRQVAGRLSERLQHLFFLQTMSNPFDLVTTAEHPRVVHFKDTDRLERLHDFIKEGHRPFYSHIHLMKSHCCKYHPAKKVFSAKSTGDEKKDMELAYDDVLLEIDGQLADLMALLDEEGIRDNTIVIFTSDHGKRWGFKDRIPMVFLFPEGAHAGRIAEPAQLVDIAPTLLDYMGIAIPSWMDGSSLLRGDLEKTRPLFAVSDIYYKRKMTDKGQRLGQVVDLGPPTYGWKEVGMIYCNRWYTLQIRGGEVKSGRVRGFRKTCSKGRLPSDEEAKEIMLRHLRERGFGI